jgi:hypothetical protein
MLEKEELLKNLKESFEKLKKDLQFDTSFDELEHSFLIKDFILEEGYVAENFFVQLSSRIAAFYGEWLRYLNGLLVPTSEFLASQTEIKLFNSEEDKKKVWDLIKIGMKFANMRVFLTMQEDKKMQAEFIDESFKSWESIFKPEVSSLVQRAYTAWKN